MLALLKAGGKPDLDAKFGANSESALHVAAARGVEAVSSALLLAGEDPNLRDVVRSMLQPKRNIISSRRSCG